MLHHLPREEFRTGACNDSKLVGLHDAHGPSLTQDCNEVQCQAVCENLRSTPIRVSIIQFFFTFTKNLSVRCHATVVYML